MESKQPNLVLNTQLVWLWKWQNSYKTGPTASGYSPWKNPTNNKTTTRQNNLRFHERPTSICVHTHELIQPHEVKGSSFHAEELPSSRITCCLSLSISSSPQLFAILCAAPLPLLFWKLIFLVALIFLVFCTLHAGRNCVTFSLLCALRSFYLPLHKATFSTEYGKQQVGKTSIPTRSTWQT